jgi:3-hydroxyisobutyrate dehydrogenase-like beta-hydroxyacid dehydrogenase
VAERSDVAITIVGDSPDVEEVALGRTGSSKAYQTMVHVDIDDLARSDAPMAPVMKTASIWTR